MNVYTKKEIWRLVSSDLNFYHISDFLEGRVSKNEILKNNLKYTFI